MSHHMDNGAGTGDSSASKRTQAEVRLLRRAIAPYGVLDRQTLEQVARADNWSEGGFEAALAAAVDAGVTTPLPPGFYEDPDPHPSRRRRGRQARGRRGTTAASSPAARGA